MTAGLALALAGVPARAAQDPVHAFNVPPSRLAEALVGFALQSGVSVGSVDLAACGARSPGVRGSLAAAPALGRILEGTGCTFVVVDQNVFRVQRLAAAGAKSALAGANPTVEAPQPLALQELVLTAPKLSGVAEQLPYAVTIVPGAALDAAQARSAADLTLDVVGLTVTNLGAGRDKIFLRGLSDGTFTGRTQATVGTYLDDVRINFDAPDPDLLLTDVEQVEVLRGPQGTLYGSGSIGGIYRIVTRKPDLEHVSGSVQVSGASTRSGSPSGSMEAMLNLPLAPDRLAVRVVGYDEILGGYLDNPRLGLSDVNGVRRSGARTTLEFRPNVDWSVSMFGVYQTIRADDAQYTNAGPLLRDTAIREPHDNHFGEAGLTIEGQGGWGRLTSSTALLRHQLTSRLDASAALSSFGAAGAAGAYDQTEHEESLVEELTLSSPMGRRLQWVAGLFLAHGQDELEEDVAFLPTGASVYREARNDNLDESAVYGEATWALTPALKLTAGLRAFDFRRIIRSSVTVPGAPSAFSGESRSSGLAPKFVADFQVGPSISLYLQAAEGYRPGGFSMGGLPSDGALGSQSRAYSADELWSYEAGLKASLWAGRVKLQAAGFLMNWRNLQSDQILASGLPFTTNVGNARNRGFEFEAAIQPVPRLTLHGGVSVDDPRLDGFGPEAAGVKDDVALPSVGRLTIEGSADYQHPLGPLLMAVLGVRAQHVGEYGPTLDEQAVNRSGNYTTLRLTAGVHGGGWRVDLHLDNPANSAADTFGFGNPFSFRRSVQKTPQRPRVMGLTIGTTF